MQMAPAGSAHLLPLKGIEWTESSVLDWLYKGNVDRVSFSIQVVDAASKFFFCLYFFFFFFFCTPKVFMLSFIIAQAKDGRDFNFIV
jgi:hypothetical protein